MDSNTSQNYTEQKDLVFVGAYSLVLAAGLTLNVTALVVFFRRTSSRSHTVVYMTNLAVADLLLVSTLPVRIYYYLGLSELGQTLCEVLGVILLINMYGSIFLLTCMSFDRCMAVCYPMSPRVKKGRKKAPLVCLGVWMLTVGASLPIYLFKTSQESDHKCFKSSPVYATRPVAVFTTLIIGFGIPMVTMVTCSWFLIRAINRSTVAEMNMIDSRKIRRMISVSLVVFVVCFLPYHLILALLYLYGPDPPNSRLLEAFHCSLVWACFNAVLDPLVYYFTTETFRKKVDINLSKKMRPLHNYSSDGNNRPCSPLNT